MYPLESKSKLNTRRARLVKEGNSSFLIVGYLDPSNDEAIRKKIEFDPSGISLKFANLTKDREILNFANTYGHLGVGNHNMQNMNCDYCYINNFQYSPVNQMECLDEWRWHISYIKRIYRLYEAIKRGEDIEDKYLRVEKWSKNNPHDCKENPQITAQRLDDLHIFWATNNKPTMAVYRPSTIEHFGIEDEYKGNAIRVIDNHILRFLSGVIYVDFSSVRLDHEAAFKWPGYVDREGLPVGVSRTDRKVTDYLLAAIYYDLFRKINNLEKIDFCTVCHSPYKSKRKGSMYCSNACKQKEKRKDKKEVDASNV